MLSDHIIRQMLLIKMAREQIELHYSMALQKGDGSNLAVLLFDLHDETARSLALRKGTIQGINAIVRAGELLGSLPIATDALPHTEAMGLIEEEFPDVAEAIKQAGDKGAYWAVVVSEGSALAVAMPAVTPLADPPAPSRRSRRPSAN